MANTYTLIESQVLGSSAASVTFSAIPATYTDLVLRVSGKSAGTSGAATDNMQIVFNGNTSTLYSDTYIAGSGSAAFSGRDTSTAYTQISFSVANTIATTTNTFGNAEIYIPSYIASQNKPLGSFGCSEANQTTTYMSAGAGLFRSTSAITSLQLYLGSAADFVTGSSFYLYGIKNS